MQSVSEKIERFAEKISNDAGRGFPFYNQFINLAKKRYGLRKEDAEDVWQNVCLRLTAENSQSMETYRNDINNMSFKEDRRFSISE